MKYRKKPVTVEAVVWTGKNLEELKQFAGGFLEYEVLDDMCEDVKSPITAKLKIKTLEGVHHASIGDYIIKGVNGEFYPCKPDIFRKTYELAE